MTEARRIYLKLNALGLAAVGVFVLSTYWPGGVISWVVGVVTWVVVAYCVFAAWGFGKLGRHLRDLDMADAESAREAFFERYPWLRDGRKQANPTVERDARKSGARPSL